MSNDAAPERRPYTAQSLERGLLALAALRDSGRSDLALSDIARCVGLHKSTVHRLVVTLERYGFVEQDPETRRYRLGLAFLEYAHQAVERLEVRRHALRVMHQLAADSGESVYLNVLAGGRTLCVDEVVGPRGVTLGSNVGVALPLHAAATGKCFLAWSAAGEREALLDRSGLERITERTITERAQLLAELEQVRRRGYATNDEETEPGVRYAAAPIFDAQGQVVAAMSLGAPVLRLSQAGLPRLGAAVMAAATRVSTALGYAGRQPALPVGRSPEEAAS